MRAKEVARNVAPRHCVVGVQDAIALRDHTLYAPFGRRDHLGRGRRASEEAHQVAGGTPAQQCAVPARPDAGKVIGLETWSLMPHAVGPAVLDEEQPFVDAGLDFLRRHLRSEELPPRHQPLRVERQLAEYLLHRPVARPHTGS